MIDFDKIAAAALAEGVSVEEFIDNMTKAANRQLEGNAADNFIKELGDNFIKKLTEGHPINFHDAAAIMTIATINKNADEAKSWTREKIETFLTTMENTLPKLAMSYDMTDKVVTNILDMTNKMLNSIDNKRSKIVEMRQRGVCDEDKIKAVIDEFLGMLDDDGGEA